MLNKPNIIIFLSDQQRWDTIGCYGQTLKVTPNLDKLAKSGVKFENAFSCQPVCGPARACIQTGKYATETGCYRNDIALPPNQKTIAHWMSETGYRCGYIGKWHLASTGGLSNENIGKRCNLQKKPIPVKKRGGWKDYWLASDLLEFTSNAYEGYLFNSEMNKVKFNKYRVDAITDYALDCINNEAFIDTKPFILFVSYLEPHHQNDQNCYIGPKGSRKKFNNFEVPGDLIDIKGDWKENYPDYLGACSSIDYNIGRIVKHLKIRGIFDNTLIIYISDHGSHFRTRNQNIINGYDDYKRSCHEASIRIPMIFHGPGFKGGRVIKELTSLIDIPPTLLNCVGIDKPDYMQGNCLQKTLEKDVKEWPEEVFIQISESKVGRAIRTKQWKFSVYAPTKDGLKDSSSDVYVENYLYDLYRDPFEKYNLINIPEYKDVKKQLSDILKCKMIEANEKEPKLYLG